MTALCQGRPCTISPDDCTVRELSLEDFGPSPDARAHIFIQWVRLCDIIGRVGQHLSRASKDAAFPAGLALELIGWVQNLQPSLKLSIESRRTRTFDRDIHNLHLPYLATVALLHMNPSSPQSSGALPQVYTTAISAASCISRIFRDLLARGHIRFLGAIGSWYASVAIIALLPTQRIESLAKHGREEMATLKRALVHMSTLWPTASMFLRGFDRVHAFDDLDDGVVGSHSRRSTEGTRGMQHAQGDHPSPCASTSSPLPDENWMHGIDWRSYFPFITEDTSDLLSGVLAGEGEIFLGSSFWDTHQSLAFQDFFETANAALPGEWILETAP